MKWCCEGLKQAYNQKYKRSIFFFAEPPDSNNKKPSFWIGMRSIDHINLKKIKEFKFPDNLAITISTRLPIHYCPWCGKTLYKFYKNNYELLVDEILLSEF